MVPESPTPDPGLEDGRGVGIRALLLDLDGTLLDSEPYHKRAEIIAFGKMGLELTVEDILPFTGMTLEKMLGFVRDRFGFPVTVDEFLSVQTPLFRKIIEEEVELFEDSVRFLNRFGAVPKVIVTSSMPWYLEVVTRKHPILVEAFDALVTAADVVHGKPDPEPFLLGCQRLNIEPGKALAIEDSVNGVRSARAAGCWVVGMDREGHGRLNDAHRVVAGFDEIEILGSLEP